MGFSAWDFMELAYSLLIAIKIETFYPNIKETVPEKLLGSLSMSQLFEMKIKDLQYCFDA
jgi:hypothetical protein